MQPGLHCQCISAVLAGPSPCPGRAGDRRRMHDGTTWLEQRPTGRRCGFESRSPAARRAIAQSANAGCLVKLRRRRSPARPDHVRVRAGECPAGLQVSILQVVGSSPTGAIHIPPRRSSAAEWAVSQTLVARTHSDGTDRRRMQMGLHITCSSRVRIPPEGQPPVLSGRAPSASQDAAVSSPLVAAGRFLARIANAPEDYTNRPRWAPHPRRAGSTPARKEQSSAPLVARERLHSPVVQRNERRATNAEHAGSNPAGAAFRCAGLPARAVRTSGERTTHATRTRTRAHFQIRAPPRRDDRTQRSAPEGVGASRQAQPHPHQHRGGR